ncbi:MAG: glycosyltransferase family 2 protein [Cyanobacteria bacterium J06600_6]
MNEFNNGKNQEKKNIYFVIVNYNSSQLIKRLVDSFPQRTKANYNASYKIVIINNSPEDRAILDLETESTKIIAAEKNLGFGQACNLGLNWIYQQNQQAIAWLINPDTYFGLNSFDRKKSPVEQAIAFFREHPQISLLGTTVYDSAGELTSAGGTFTPGSAALATVDTLPTNLTTDYWETDWTSGCSLLVNLANFARCPLFDPRYFLYYEDLDFCLRYGQQGHKIAVTSRIKVFHDTSSISDRNLFVKYQHITRSYLIHIEKHGNLPTFIRTNVRMSLNTLRLLVFRPQQGWGKLIGIYRYWRDR